MKLSLYYKLIIYHVLLAVATFLFRPLALLYFVVMIAFFSYKIFSVPQKLKSFYVLLACAYVVGIEVFLRMNNGTFFYEASKYLVIVFMLMGLFFNSFSNQSLAYVFYLVLLIPSIFVSVEQIGYEINIRRAIAFNLSGPVCLGISAIFCYRRHISFNQIKSILLVMLLPLISTTAYLVLYAPNLKGIIHDTGSNFATSGGFGPNQVATVLGIGLFVLATRFFTSKERIYHKLFDLSLLTLMGFRALVTFSRGGIFTAVIMILFFLVVYYLKVNLKTKFRIKVSLIIFLCIVAITWLISSLQTSGFLDKRYANQDAAGREKEDVTTGRLTIATFEINQFLDHPFFGIGVGRLKEERINETGIEIASHNEVTRIIGEHGLFGILALLTLLLTPLTYRLRNKANIFFYSFYLFWFLTINHSAMRIAAPAFIYALCLLNITYEKPTLSRKPVIAKQ